MTFKHYHNVKLLHINNYNNNSNSNKNNKQNQYNNKKDKSISITLHNKQIKKNNNNYKTKRLSIYLNNKTINIYINFIQRYFNYIYLLIVNIISLIIVLTPIKNEIVSISLYSLKSICWCSYYISYNNNNNNSSNNNNNNSNNNNNNIYNHNHDKNQISNINKFKIMLYSLIRTYLSSLIYYLYNNNIEKYLIWKLSVSFLASLITIFTNQFDQLISKINIFTRIYYTLYTQNLFYQKISYFKMVSSVINTFTEFKFQRYYFVERFNKLLLDFGISFILYEINLYSGLSISIILAIYKTKTSFDELEYQKIKSKLNNNIPINYKSIK